MNKKAVHFWHPVVKAVQYKTNPLFEQDREEQLENKRAQHRNVSFATEYGMTSLKLEGNRHSRMF